MLRRRVFHAPLIFWLIMVMAVFVICMVNGFLLMSVGAEGPCQCPDCGTSSEIEFNSIDEITFVTVPRPGLKPEQFQRAKLAIASWLSVSPKSRVLLFVNRTEYDPTGTLPDELDKIFGAGRVLYAGSVRHDFGDVPYIDDWFRQGVKKAKSKYICFINADILLSNGWLSRVKQVYSVMEDKPVVLIGQRIDFDLDQSKYEQLTWNRDTLLREIDDMVQNSKHADHSPFGVDSFTFRTDKLPFDVNMIPPFIMGRYNWDNWIIGYLNTFCDTVTFNLEPPIYHINHARHDFNTEDDRVAVNDFTKKANKDYFGSNYDTKWEVVNNKLSKRGRGTVIDLPAV